MLVTIRSVHICRLATGLLACALLSSCPTFTSIERVLLYALGLSVVTGLSWVWRQPYRLRAGDP
jgi:hypothetical protein